MSDLGNRGWPNSMKLGENIDLDELLLDLFYLSSCYLPFAFSGGGGSYFGVSEYKKTPI